MRTDEHLPEPALTWSQLRAFGACIKLLNFNAAAAALGLTPAAVRHQIVLLESRLRATLFLRRAGRLDPTQVGLAFSADIAEPLRALAAACAKAATGAATTPIRLTAPPLFARRFLMDKGFLKWCKNNDVNLDISEVKRDLSGTSNVVAIRFGSVPDPDLLQVRLLDVVLVIACAPSIARSARAHDHAWWREQTILSPQVAEHAWPMLWKQLGWDSVEPRHHVQFTSHLAALEAARHGRGIVLVPLPVADTDVRSGDLVMLTDIRLSPEIGYDFVLRRELAATNRGRILRRRVFNTVNS